MTESPSQTTTLVDLMRLRAEQEAERQAFTFLVDGEVEGPSISFGKIDRQARAIGGALQQHALKGERALLLYPTGLEFVAAFYGTLYGGAIAVTAPLPVASRVARTLPRLEAIAKDAQPKIALTTSAVMSEMEKTISSSMELRSIRWMTTDTLA